MRLKSLMTSIVWNTICQIRMIVLQRKSVSPSVEAENLSKNLSNVLTSRGRGSQAKNISGVKVAIISTYYSTLILSFTQLTLEVEFEASTLITQHDIEFLDWIAVA